MHVEAAGDQAIDYVLDLGVGGAFLHYDDHVRAGFPSKSFSQGLDLGLRIIHSDAYGGTG
jgi:hypothetical protein